MPGVAPFLVACAIGGINAVVGLADRDTPSAGGEAFLLTVLVAVIAASVLSASIRAASSRQVPLAVIGVGLTYGGVMAGRQAGPLSAGLVGLALLGLAHLSHREILLVRELPAQTIDWSRRTVLAVTVSIAVLDGVIALVARGGPAKPGSPATWSVAAGCAAVTAVVALVTALADGVQLPGRLLDGAFRRTSAEDATLTLDQ